MSNPFSSINFSELKNVYNNAIDALLDQNAISLPCQLIYASNEPELCNNCVFDHINQKSLNRYNNTGPAPFADMSICPVCNGLGFDKNNLEELVHLGVIFDSKYWFNWNSNKSNPIHVPDGSIQTICKSDLLPKIRNASKLMIDPSMHVYGSYYYTRANDPELAGFGESRYIFTRWNRT